jgi:parallel beta-helix repeat protein
MFLTTGDTSYISSTIIDGSSNLDYVVSFENEEDSTAAIIGFTITGLDYFNGGVYCNGTDPTISYNHIVNNPCGIYCYDSNPIISYNHIVDNVNSLDGFSGTGIYCDHCFAHINNNIIAGNEVHSADVMGAGGGMSISNCNAVISDNVISDNIAVGGNRGSFGGGIYISGSSGVIRNNVISGNYSNHGGGISYMNITTAIIGNLIIDNYAICPGVAVGHGGGIFCRCIDYDTSTIIMNNTIVGNEANDGGGIDFTGIFVTDTFVRCINNIIWGNLAETCPQICGNPAEVAYCNIQDTLCPGVGNISVDPLFRDTLNNDFHLQDSIDCGDPGYSPCIDAGHPEITDSLLDCAWGLGTDRSDMGAYGGGDWYLPDPEPIDDLVITLSSNTNITLSWSPVINALSYHIYKSTVPGGEFGHIGSTSDTAYVDVDAVVNASAGFYYVTTDYGLPWWWDVSGNKSHGRNRIHELK